MRRRSSAGGGRKTPWGSSVRAEAMRIARSRGPVAAARQTGVPEGTVRSWVRRAELKGLHEDTEPDPGLAALKAEGERMLREREERAEEPPVQPPPPPPPAPQPSATPVRRVKRLLDTLRDAAPERTDPAESPSEAHGPGPASGEPTSPSPPEPEPEPEGRGMSEAEMRSLAARMGRLSGAESGPAVDTSQPRVAGRRGDGSYVTEEPPRWREREDR